MALEGNGTLLYQILMCLFYKNPFLLFSFVHHDLESAVQFQPLRASIMSRFLFKKKIFGRALFTPNLLVMPGFIVHLQSFALSIDHFLSSEKAEGNISVICCFGHHLFSSFHLPKRLFCAPKRGGKT